MPRGGKSVPLAERTPRQADDRPCRSGMMRAFLLRLRDRLVTAIVVADPDPEYSTLDHADGLHRRVTNGDPS